jgi:hemolysin activation/secretion protein
MDSQLLGQLEFDDISSLVTDMHGIRGIGQVGAYWRDGIPSRVWKGEMFYFHLWDRGWNLAWHLEGVESQASHFDRLQFVGGLDAVRGFPDGYLNGPRSISMNTELRYVGWKFDHVWLQAVLFQDMGWAGEAWDRASDNAISSVGTGLRVVLPGINRFVIRVDYGVSLSDPDVRGISAGLNQFFQPYKPLDAAP